MYARGDQCSSVTRSTNAAFEPNLGELDNYKERVQHRANENSSNKDAANSG